MQAPFRGENRITTFHTAVTMPFLVTASGKQAGAAALLVLWKPSCDGQQGHRKDGQVSHLDLHTVTPVPGQTSCCILTFAIQWKANMGSKGLTAFGWVRFSFLCFFFKIIFGVIGIFFLHLCCGL